MLALGLAAFIPALSRTAEEAELPPLKVDAQTVAFSMAPLAILGAIPRTRTLFGYWPLFGAEVSTHGAFAALSAYAGFRDTLANSSDVIRPDLIQRQDDERLLAARG